MALTFTVEDGTGKADANSYVSTADADDYIALRGLTGWPSTTAAKEAALVKATDWIDQNYMRMFSGTIYLTSQALQWPRSNAYYHYPTYDVYNVDGELWDQTKLITGVPKEVKKACIELALASVTTELEPTIPEALDGFITEYTTEVGPIKETTKYADGSRSQGACFVKAEKLLAFVCFSTTAQSVRS